MKVARKPLVLALCALLFVSFTLMLTHKSFAAEVTITGTIRSGKIMSDKRHERYTIVGVYAEEVNKMQGKRVELTGTIDHDAETIDVTTFKEIGRE